MWIFLGLVSCLLLGLYDVAKKLSLKDNAVIPVLFFASATGSLLFSPILVLSHLNLIPESSILYAPSIGWSVHGLIFLKSLLVGSSWIFAYYALHHLPLTIVTPIRATGPVWTLLGALIIYHEVYNGWQWAGITVIFVSFYLFSKAGNKEGIVFKSNRWILFMIIATLLGSASTLYDKFLIGHYPRMAVQAWFSVYMIPIFLPFLLFLWYPKRKTSIPFKWRWWIPVIGILLSLADFAYFYALAKPEALITILSLLRRTSVIISFAGGALIFRESNLKRKGWALLGILAGVALIVLGS
jgi:transporter family protein